MLDKNERATRQAQLQKALSTAYLNHQISELESRVHAIDLPNGHHDHHGNHERIAESASSRGGRGRCGGGFGRRHGEENGRGGHEGGLGRGKHGEKGRIDDSDEDRDQEVDKEWRVVVVDVSALLWAPKAVKRVMGKGWEVILPLEAIRTLDLLKKGNSPTAQAARGAARYIEHASRHHRLLSADPSVTVQLGTDYKKGRGLRLQRDDEYRAPETISELAIPPVDGAAQMPKWVVSVLSCAAFFVRIAFAEAAVDDKPDGEEFDEAKPVLLVANPPLAVEVEMVEGERKGENGPNFAERGEGYLISQEAERFELNLEVLRDEDAEEFVFDAELGRGKGHRRGDGGGGGRGRGGRGRGGGRGGARKQPEEPEREVKILLRRPQSNDERSPHPNQSSLPPILEPRSVSEHLSPMPPVAQVRPIPEHPQPPPFEHMPLPPGHGSPPPPPGHGPPPPPPWHIRSPRGNMLPPRDHHGHSSPHSPDYRYAGSSDHPSPFAPDYHYFPRPPPDAFRGGRGRGGRGRGGPDGLRGLGGGPDGFRGHGGGRGRGGGFTLLQRPGPPPGPPPVAHPGDEPRVVLLHRPK